MKSFLEKAGSFEKNTPTGDGLVESERSLDPLQNRRENIGFLLKNLIFGPAVLSAACHANPNQPQTSSEKNLQRLIQETEEGMRELKKLLTPCLETIPADQKALLLAPFELLETNQSYPHKNKEITRRRNPEGHSHDNKNQFYYDIQEKEQYFDANEHLELIVPTSFSIPDRTLYLPDDAHKDNIISLYDVYHELVHALQDSHYRCSRPEEYRAELALLKASSQPLTILNDELEAESLTSELMNLHLKDALRRSALGQESLDLQLIRSIFHTSSDIQEIRVLQNAIEVGRSYFQAGPKITIPGLLETKAYPETFMQKIIASRLMKPGTTICVRTENGLQRIEQTKGE